MVSSTQHLHEPTVAEINQSLRALFLSQTPAIDEATSSRKGYLYWLAEQAVPPEQLQGAYRAFYTGSIFDIQANLAAAWNVHPLDPDQTIAAIVIHDLSLYALATPKVAIWLWRHGHLLPVLPDPRGTLRGLPSSEAAGPLQQVQRRLYPGDMIIVTAAASRQRLTEKAMRRAAQMSLTLDSLAAAVGRLLSAGRKGYPSLCLIQLPTPAGMLYPEAEPSIELVRSGRDAVAVRKSGSPIRLALFLAIIIVIAALLLGLPSWPKSAAELIFQRVILSSLTATPQTATPTLTSTPAN